MNQTKDNTTNLSVGIDVGENSVGMAAVLCDSQGMPIDIPYALTVIHDSGKDGMASGQTATVSRKASGGVARRARRLLKNRRKRSRKLQNALSKFGYPLVEADSLQTYDEWNARISLLRGFISDEDDRNRKLSIAIRHMSNHRGWANAWVPIDHYVWKEEPSKEFDDAATALVEHDLISDVQFEDLKHQADIAQYGLNQGQLLRNRVSDPKKRPHALTSPNLLGVQRRVDVVREWRQICRVQNVSDEHFLTLARIAFGQEKPKVPAENVGRDWLPGFKDKLRATVASLEHQEFQIRQTIANLRVIDSEADGGTRRLSVGEQNLILDNLMGTVNEDKIPTWRDIAEDFLDIPARKLRTADAEGSISGRAPVMRSVITIHKLPKRHPVLLWWQQANMQKRSEFILWLADPVEISGFDTAEYEELFEGLEEKELEAVSKVSFPSGRSAHCLESLRLMIDEIKATGDSYVEVRNRLFNDGKDLRPTNLQTLETESDHPTLQRILPIVRRFLLGIENSQLPRPNRVVVEHVRSALMGFNAKREFAMQQGKNRKANERAVADIEAAGLALAHPSDGEIKKFLALRRQNSSCLYCGNSITWSSCQMDHIVPRKSGGNNTRANLVAVCEPCNQAKGKMPFAVFAASGKRPGVSFDETLERVQALSAGEIDKRAFAQIKKEMARRLKQREEDEAIDERSLATTAYAATDIIDRIKTYYDDPTGRIAKVYSGRIVSMARHASGIDKRVRVREGIDVKSRFDRRHHAIDAVVAALITPTVARVLAMRADLRDSARNTGEINNWETFAGYSNSEREAFEKWKLQMHKVAEILEAKMLRDEVVVMQQVRYSANHSALHEDGRISHRTKAVGEEWSPQERALIVDDRVYAELSRGISPADLLAEDDGRLLRLPSGKKLDSEGLVYLFPDTAARIPLPNQSSAKLGQSIHHARLYRWFDAKGKVQAKFVRLFASDLYDLQDGISGDLLTAELNPNSRAARRSDMKLREALHAGNAEHVGSIVVGDELYIEPEEWQGDNEPGKFLAEWPERHWRLAGFMSDVQFTVTPVLLSQEGALKASETDEVRSRKLVAVSDLAYKVISDRLRISSSMLWQAPGTMVVRRTAMGAPRFETSSGLPVSWSPYEAVHR